MADTYPHHQLSVSDAKEWLEQELQHLDRNYRARKQEVALLVSDYVAGRISPPALQEKMLAYFAKWDKGSAGGMVERELYIDGRPVALRRGAQSA